MEKEYNTSNIFDFIKVVEELSEPESEILLRCYHEGRLTFHQIVNYFKEKEPSQIRNAIQNLLEKKLLFLYKFQNFEFYELNLPTIRYLTQYEKFPSGPIIPLVYQFNLLCDSTRLSAFKSAIEQNVKEGDIVIDIGSGTGVLSIFAAKKGAYVFAIEIDPLVAEASEYFIKSNGYASQIKIIQEDSRALDLDIKADVIICEMLDTALISELQVPVMNNAVKKWLKPDGKVIPVSAETYAELVNVDYRFEGIDFRLIHFEEYGARKSSYSLSDPFIYHTISFDKENPLELSTKFSLRATRDGIANGIRLKTEVLVSDNIKIGGTPWFNPPLVLPFEDIKVKKGDIIEVQLYYSLGGGFSSIKYNVQRVD